MIKIILSNVANYATLIFLSDFFGKSHAIFCEFTFDIK